MTYIIDACALLAFLNEELGKGYETVKDLLDRAVSGEVILYMSLVNLVEVHYRFIQLRGVDIANAVMEPVIPYPLLMLFYALLQKTLTQPLLPKIRRSSLSRKLSLFLSSGYNNFSKLSHFQNPVSFENGFGKTSFSLIFPLNLWLLFQKLKF